MVTIEAYRASIGCFFVTLNNRYTCKKDGKSSVRKVFHRNARRTKSTIHKSFLRKTQESQRSSIATFLLPIRLMFLFIITLISIDMAFLKVSLLLIDGDIESNPGPSPIVNKIQKAVLGTFHQGHSKFGNTAGIQCLCNALYAVCFSVVKKVSIWKPFDLDYILENGDETFKRLGISRSLFMSELPRNVLIENYNIEIEMLDHYYGLLGKKNIFEDHVLIQDTGNGLLLMTGGFTIALIWSKNSVFLFDSHSQDSNGAFTTNGVPLPFLLSLCLISNNICI